MGQIDPTTRYSLTGANTFVFTKDWYKSKTVWIAILQFVAGAIAIVVGLLHQQNSLDTVGLIAAGKAVIDLYLRLKTDTGLETPFSK